MTHAIVDTLNKQLRLFRDGVHICVAFSGGEDSTVLLHALAAQRAEFPQLQLSAHHVHHGLSANADAWAAHCQQTCDQWAIPLVITRVRVDPHAKQGIEAAAREARYRALFEQSPKGVTHIALAHHTLDQAETVLLQALRGAGPEGLAAMGSTLERSSSAAPIGWRPLLDVRKQSITEYAQHFDVKFIVDESNADERFARNRLRHAVWPSLIAAFPGAETTLARAAGLQAEAAVLQRDIAEFDARTCLTDDTLQLNSWRMLSFERRKNLLRYWIAQHACPALSFDRLIEWDRQLFAADTEQDVNLPTPQHRTSIRVYRSHAYWVRARNDIHDLSVSILTWEGTAETPFGDGAVIFSAIGDTDTVCDASPAHTTLRAPRAREVWALRTRREGDAIELSANSGRITYKNIMQHAGIPPWQRDSWPVLTCNGVVAALPGLCASAAFAPESSEAAGALSWKPDRKTRETP